MKNRDKREEPAKTAAEYKTVYVSMRREVYEAICRAAKDNCRSVGGELVYAWREWNKWSNQEAAK